MDSQARTPRCDLSHGKRSFQGKFLLCIWLFYLASGLSLAGLHLLGMIEVPRIQPAEEVLREEEILHVLQRFKTGLPGVEQKKLAWLIQRESARYGQDYRLVLAIIKTESSFQYRAISRKGTKGLMQIWPYVG